MADAWSVVVTREPLWDDDDREAAYAVWQDDLERCPECGLPRSVCSDPEVDWYPQRSFCYATAARVNARRRWDKRVEGMEPDSHGRLEGDGMTIWVARDDLSPNDDFLADRPAQPGGAGD